MNGVRFSSNLSVAMEKAFRYSNLNETLNTKKSKHFKLIFSLPLKRILRDLTNLSS